MGALRQFHLLFALVPRVYFFAKDNEGRFVAASPELVRRSGLSDESEMLGRCDHDLYPAHLADAFVRDDRQIMLTGEPIVDKVEVWFSSERLQDWFVTTKMPIRDDRGDIIGVMGFTRSHEGERSNWAQGTGLEKAVEHIRTHYKETISIAVLAKAAGLSKRQLERRFQDAFSLAPQDFISRTRIQSACEALIATEASVNDIALDHGYSDQSAFSRQFKKHTGQTPVSYRKNGRKRTHL
jgi:AraC-like DNA-binding protein